MSAVVESNCVVAAAAIPKPSAMEAPVSIYIPQMKMMFNLETVYAYMSQYGIVERIDFVQRKNYVTKEVDDKYKRAYVHFIDCGRAFIDSLEKDGKVEVTPFYDAEMKPMDTWTMYPSKSKVPATELNIHQLAHTYQIIDDKVIDLEQDLFCKTALIEQLQDKNEYLENSLKELQETVIQMQLHLAQLSENK